MPEYYTFTREDDTDGISYVFRTPTHLYSVVFALEMYYPFLDDFPNLLTNGYEFSFFKKQYIFQKKKDNQLIRGTIFKIIESHFDEQGSETVLLYRCDTSDGMQKRRAEIFNNWYSCDDCYLNSFLIKESLQVVIPQENGSEKTHYIGYIAHRDNPNLTSVQEEFNLFAYYLPSFSKDAGQ